jgi:hypothetical protein
MRWLWQKLSKILKQLFNSWDEWHAFVIGFTEVYKGDCDVPYPINVIVIIHKEYWYYKAGICFGLLSIGAILILGMLGIIWMFVNV